MRAKVLLVSNGEEVDRYQSIIDEYGEDEAYMTGKVTYEVKPIYNKYDLLFNMEDVKVAWLVKTKDEVFINIELDTGQVWSLDYKEEIWNKLVEKFV